MSPGHGNNPVLAHEGPLLLQRDGRLPRITVHWTGGKPTERVFAPEGAVSLAAAARLVLDYGYPVDTVELAPRSEVDGVASEHPSRDSRPILAFEAKQDDDELRAMVVGIEACGGTAGTTRDTFELLHRAQIHGARVALFGRKIQHAESQLHRSSCCGRSCAAS